MYNEIRLTIRKKKVESVPLEYGLIKIKRETPIIISFTSFLPRLDSLHYVVRSLLQQSIKPDRIILYLGEDVIPEDLPDSLRKMKRYGLEIEFRKDNLKSHKKYYYAMSENPNAIIVTVDDDLIYPSNMLALLLDAYKDYSDCVIAARVHKMTFDQNGNIRPYKEWDYEYTKPSSPSKCLFATGGAGCLYPPHLLDDSLLDATLINQLCLNADDVWLKFMEIRNNVKVKMAKKTIWENTLLITEVQDVGLYHSNVFQYDNDVYMQKCLNYFKLSGNAFIDS